MAETRTPIITLTTDFGDSDHYVAAVKAAILTVSTQITIVDVTHQIPAHDVMEAAWVLRNAYAAFPRSTVHMAVVDPGVGTSRRPIIASIDGHSFVGPDNGIFSHVFEVEAPSRVVEITAAHYMRPSISPTFHARDVFAPAAAHLARGADPARFGDVLDRFVRLELPRPAVAPDGSIKTVVAHVDRFGNVILNLTRPALEALLEKTGARRFAASFRGARIDARFATYGDAPQRTPFLLFNSADMVEIAANQGRAVDLIGAKPGDAVDLLPLPA